MDILLVVESPSGAEVDLFDRVLAEICIGMETVCGYAKALKSLARHRHSIVVLAELDVREDLRTAETIRIMKEIVPDVLIIGVSQELSIDQERELREAGLYYYLTRPLDETELRDLLAGAIAKQMPRRETS